MTGRGPARARAHVQAKGEKAGLREGSRYGAGACALLTKAAYGEAAGEWRPARMRTGPGHVLVLSSWFCAGCEARGRDLCSADFAVIPLSK